MNKLDTLFDRNLLKRLHHLDHLSLSVCEALSLDPDKHALWVIKSMRVLTIMTSDTILATRLRFEQAIIIDYLARHKNIQINEIKVKLAHVTTPAPKQQMPNDRMHVSPASADVLSHVAETLDDEELKQCLLNLAKLAR